MKKLLLFLLLVPLIGLTQVQIGQNMQVPDWNDHFGWSVDISSDGSIIAAGANGSYWGYYGNYVKVFQNINGTWTQIGQDLVGNHSRGQFGWCVSLSSDGSIIAVGDPFIQYSDGAHGYYGTGYVRIYENVNGTWTQIGQDIQGTSEDSANGYSISLSADGTIIAIGAIGVDHNYDNRKGSTRIFQNVSNVWTQVGQTIDGEFDRDGCGYSVSLSSDGSTVAIGSPFNDDNGPSSGYVRIFKNINNTWTQLGQNIMGQYSYDVNGEAVSLSSDGTIVAIGGTGYNYNNSAQYWDQDAGYVRIFKYENNVWTQIGQNIEGEHGRDKNGQTVSLSSDGTYVAMGTRFNSDGGNAAGHARVFRNENGVWTQIGIDIDGENVGDALGKSVSLSSDANTLVVGAPYYGARAKVYDMTVLLSTENFELQNINIYPNPTQNVINIDLPNSIEVQSITLYDLVGKKLLTTTNKNIDISSYNSGMYILEIETNKGKSTRKIVKE